MKIISECSRQKPVYQIDATISNSQCPHMLPSNNEYLGVIYRPPPPSAIKNEGIHEGERVIVCMRSRKMWGLTPLRTGQSLFAPDVTRSGHMPAVLNATESRLRVRGEVSLSGHSCPAIDRRVG